MKGQISLNRFCGEQYHDKDYTIPWDRLRFSRANDQVAFHTEQAVKCLKYLIACTVKSGQRHRKDDWSFPGKVYAGILPQSLEEFDQEHQLQMEVIMDGLAKNHGYYKHMEDGAEEMAVISPFHGDAISIYRQENGRMRKVYEYEKPAEFSHAIFGGMIGEKPAVVIGHREGERNLLLFSWDQLSRQFQAQILDRGCGSANAYRFYNHGEAYLLSANRETDEAVLYQLRL